jgi:hypothetical protein
MPLVPTPARVKLLDVCDRYVASCVFTRLPVDAGAPGDDHELCHCIDDVTQY